MEICSQVNIIPLNTNFSSYNIKDKATSIMSKNIETGIINCLLVLDSNWIY